MTIRQILDSIKIYYSIQRTISDLILLTFLYILNNLIYKYKNNSTKITVVTDWILQEKKKISCMKHAII